MEMFNYCLLVLSIVWCLVNAQTTRYNSSDLSYLSNGIQFPVPASELHNPIVADLSYEENLPEIKWLSELYSHLKWLKYLKTLNNTKCRDDMTTYIKELLNGTSWAAKMYDASGRYGGQFFFGNDYWLGSETLCRELANVETNNEVPPFPVYFYVAKVRININRHLTPVTRQLNVGECLPSSCKVNDVRLLLSQERNQGATLNIVGVRAVPGDYVLLEDIKFQIIGGTSLLVGVIIFFASLLEVIMKYKYKSTTKDHCEIENNNNNNNNSTASNNSNNNTNDECNKDVNKGNGKGMVLKKNERDIKPSQNIALKIILCFSAVNNGKKILNVDTATLGSIRCIHGLRFFSIAWIILVHTYLEVFSIADNKNMRIITERTFMYQTISNATFSVDTFFYISGLLVTITYFRTASKKTIATTIKDENSCQAVKNNIFKFIILVIYRFFRLTPAYLFVLGVNEIILRYLHSYSVFSPAIIDHISCSKFWWRNALYINNFYPQTEFCMLWSWYISNDTQFYLIAIILLLIAVRGEKHLKFAGAALIVFLISSWIITFVIAMKYDYVARVEEPFALFDQLYDKPWMRIGPYLIGMIAGYFLFKVNCNITLSPLTVIIGWSLSLSCLASLVYGLGRQGLVVPASAFYASLGHTAWGLSLGWITIACCSGYGGPLNSLFSCKLFLPLSRLSYCAYLIHPVLMCLSSFILDGPIHLQQMFVVVIYLGNVVLSFLCAFGISLSFEAPVVNLLKIIFSKQN